MLKTVIIAEDPLAPETWESLETEDVCELLTERFDVFPANARIYHGSVCEGNDVTPHTDAEIDTLQKLEGRFFVIVYAADPVSLVYFAVGALIAVLAVTVFAPDIPDVPEPLARKQDNSSPNNELAERKNRPRINGRIPDIFGTVRSTPDLIAPIYTVYENSLRVEHSLLCIGRGEYEIPEAEIQEGATPVSQISDNSLEIYAPGVNPNPSNTPQVQIGNRIAESFLSTQRNNAVNGQTLNPTQNSTIVGSNDIGFFTNYKSNGFHEFYIGNNGSTNFRDFIAAGSQVQVTDVPYTLRKLDLTKPGTWSLYPKNLSYAGTLVGEPVLSTIALDSFPTTGTTFTMEFRNTVLRYDGTDYDLSGVYRTFMSAAGFVLKNAEEVNSTWTTVLGIPGATSGTILDGFDIFYTTEDISADASGTYTVTGVDEDKIFLYEADKVNSEWGNILLQEVGDNALSAYHSPTLENLTGNEIGPFTVDDPETTEILVNFSAVNGLYKDSGTVQTEVNVEIETTIEHLDANGDPDGTTQTFTTTVNGSSTSKGSRSKTGRFLLSKPTRCRVTAQRLTPFVTGFTGQVVEEVKWVDLYAAKGIDSLDFGDVTIARSKARATAGATAAESRELNLLVTRKIPQRVSGSDFTAELFPTNRADEILSFIALDPRIGNRSKDELDFDSIYSTVQAVEDYFGTAIAAEFNYTFDSDNISFEESVISVAKAIFCTAYRRGNQIKLTFERETENSTLLFNHRNKLPGSETRTVRFGNRNDNDGVEFEYVDPDDDSVETFYLPDQNALNPLKIDMPGIRNRLQAYFHAYRSWNKIRYQHVATEFEATQEADLLVLTDRILNADNTRPDIQDGEVLDYYGTELELSQKVVFADGLDYTIFLQRPDGTVEAIGATAGSTDRHVILAAAPTFALSIDPLNYARTTYLLVSSAEQAANAFIVTEKHPKDNFTSSVSAINYDSRYYDNDKDLENGIVGTDGNPV